MASLLSRLWPRSEFFRNVATLATGTAAAQAVSLLSAPINSRLYTPADYGALGAYMSVSGLLTTAATLLYHHPVVLTESDDDARDLVGACLAASLGIALLALCGALLLGPAVASHFKIPELRWWFLGVPISTLCSGAGTAFSAWSNRKKGYRALATTRVLTALLPLPVTIGCGIYIDGPMGLLAGLLLSHLGLALSTAVVARQLSLRVSQIRPHRVRALAKRYREYPLFTLPTDLITTLTTWLPVYLLVAFAGPAAVGAYSMSNRLLGIPSTLIGNSIGEVFRQQAASDCAERGECRSVFMKTIKHTSALAVPGFVLIAVAGPLFFSYVLGAHWREAGRVAQVLAPLFCLRFVVSPISVMYYLRDRLREDLALHIALLALIAAGMTAASFVSATDLSLLTGYGVAYGFIYLVYLLRCYQLAGPAREVMQKAA